MMKEMDPENNLRKQVINKYYMLYLSAIEKMELQELKRLRNEVIDEYQLSTEERHAYNLVFSVVTDRNAMK